MSVTRREVLRGGSLLGFALRTAVRPRWRILAAATVPAALAVAMVVARLLWR